VRNDSQAVTSDEVLARLFNVARDFDGPARDTLLFHNRGKHLVEISLILEHLPPGGSVLDIGGGMGVNLLAVSGLRQAKLHLIDRFEEYDADNPMGHREVGLRLLRAAGVHVTKQDFWPEPKLPVEPNSLDVITLFDVVEHLPGSPLPLLDAVCHALKSQGTLILGGPNSVELVKRVKLALGRHPYMPFDLWVQNRYYSHYREYDAREYEKLVRRVGFTVRKRLHVAEPHRTEARFRFHRKHRSRFSPVILGLQVANVVETILPQLRSAIYIVASPTAS
jgi:SAM-dependent methyltransferase